MSWRFAEPPACPDCGDHVDVQIVPSLKDLGGGFTVRRVLPSPRRMMVGPFIFFDQMGPSVFTDGGGIDVRPHPHIGLATITYLFKGEFQHFDSLGTNLIIRPGEVNWMIAGRGITHSERTSAATRQGTHEMFGIQTWVALPKAFEDIEPDFQHFDGGALPELRSDGRRLRLIIGSAYGETAPAKTFSAMFYVAAELEAGAEVPLPEEHEERAIYVVEGSVLIGGVRHGANEMLVFHPHDTVCIKAGESGARLMLLGGAPMDGPRYVWWNYVASSRERIEEAKAEWRKPDHGRFTLPPDDDGEFIPLPSR